MLDPAYGKTPADRRALLNGGGLTIRTTLNIGDQRAAQAAVENYIPTGDPSGRVAAIAMIEPGYWRHQCHGAEPRLRQGPR